MSPEQKRKFNTFFGSLFLISGMAAWGLSTYYATTPNEPMPAPVSVAKRIDLKSCEATLRSLGYPEVSVQKNDVIAHEAMSSDPQGQLQKASIAASACKLDLKYFCIGGGCPQPGITIITTAPPRSDGSPAVIEAADKNKAEDATAKPASAGKK